MLRNALDNKPPLELIQLGFGLFLITVASLSFIAAGIFMLSSNSADGRVVAFQVNPKLARSEAAKAGIAARAPVIEFMADDGKPTRIVGDFYERDSSYALDQVVPIRYLSSSPEAGVIDVFSEKWAFPLAIGITGLFFVIASRFFRRKPGAPGRHAAAS